MSEYILDLKGAPVKMDGKFITVGECCTAALLHVYQDEQNQSMQAKVQRYKLAQKFAACGDNNELPKLSAEEVTEVKTCVSKFWSPLVVGRVFEVLDPQSME